MNNLENEIHNKLKDVALEYVNNPEELLSSLFYTTIAFLSTYTVPDNNVRKLDRVKEMSQNLINITIDSLNID